MVELPDGAVVEVEIGLDAPDVAELRAAAEADGLAPRELDVLLRYLVYLGAAYLIGERPAGGDELERLQRLTGAVSGRNATLRFAYFEASRRCAAEERARAAHEQSAGSYELIVEQLRREIATREERVRDLEEALAR